MPLTTKELKKTNYLQDLWANKSVYVNFTLTKILDEPFLAFIYKNSKTGTYFLSQSEKYLRNLCEFEKSWNWLFKLGFQWGLMRVVQVALQWGLMRAVQAALQWGLMRCLFRLIFSGG